ncbi:MAG TPA: replication-relaxation family protein [Candidatus Limnocylindrales bacterium]|nr:replication-relaxation family protein [Candidatus Limnocylindrales bacterium]
MHSTTGNSSKVIIQERDRRLFSELAHLGLASSEQVRVLSGFGSMRRSNDRTHRLVAAGYLRRCFIGTTSGGKRSVFALAPKAAALLGIASRPVSFKNDDLVTSDQFLRHQLQITEFYLAVRYLELPPDIRFLRWRRFRVTLSETIRLIPDGYCELGTLAGVRGLFLEVDLGNEALRIWQQKVENYLQLALSGEFQRIFGQKQFRVLVLANSERRLLSLRQKVAAATDKIFWFATLNDIHNQGLWAPVWLRPTGTARQSLL